jgi:spore germination protein KA
MINDNIIRPLMLSSEVKPGENLIDTIIEKVIQVNDASKTDNFKEIVKAITYGDTILFAEGANQAVILSTKAFALRSIAEPDNEKVLSGPREGFSESLMQNLSLVRRRVRTNDLK